MIPLIQTAAAPLPELLTMKSGIALMERMSLVEFAIMAHITGDPSPLTSSPNQRRSIALVMVDVASSFMALATAIDPLAPEADLGFTRLP